VVTVVPIYLKTFEALKFLTGAEKVVKIWSPETGQFMKNLTGHTQGLSDIAWSGDSKYLASASDDTTIRIWNVQKVSLLAFFHARTKELHVSKGATHKVLKGHANWVFCINYNTASNLLVSGGCEGDVRIWNVARGGLHENPALLDPSFINYTGKCMKTLHAHMDYVTAVHFNRDASLIVSCALDGLMYVTLACQFVTVFDSFSTAEFGTQVTANASKHWLRDMMQFGMYKFQPKCISSLSFSTKPLF